MNTPYGHYGQDEAGWLSVVSELVPGVSGILEKIADPVRDVQVLEAQLAAAKARGAGLAELQKIEGKLQAAIHRAELQLGRERSAEQWSNIGKIASIAGITVLVGLGILIGVKTINAARRGKNE